MSQTHVLEYRIDQSADGVTPAPQFDIAGQPATQGIYVFDVDNLGLIDLSFSGQQPTELAAAPSSIGQRYVSWLWAKNAALSGVNPVRSANDVDNAGYVDVELLETLPLAITRFYSRKGYIMPHGTVLRLQDMVPAVAGEPLVVRLAVVIPETQKQDSLFRQSFCCTDTIATIAS